MCLQVPFIQKSLHFVVKSFLSYFIYTDENVFVSALHNCLNPKLLGDLLNLLFNQLLRTLCFTK